MSLPTYAPEPYVDFTQPEPISKMKAALDQVRGELGKHYPLTLEGEQVTTDARIKSVNPARPSEVVGEVSKADADMADRAIRFAHERFQSWRHFDPEARGRILIKASHLMRRRIYEFSATMVYEVSKSWIEAYADTAEAIDFLDFYGREMMRIGGAHEVTPFEGEENQLRYVPLGVVSVIPPWNFPLAIMAGMSAAAFVTGNTVVLKPASTSPIVAAKFVELMREAGLPEGVLSFCPGSGGEIGDLMVQHPLTRMIAFTGSKEVGLRINELAAKPVDGCQWIKRVILEMGGKDCCAADETADVDMLVDEAVKSGYGFQGQKCSAGSRLIVHQDIYDEVVEKMTARVKELSAGFPTDENAFMGAVIDGNAKKKIEEMIEVGKGEAKLVAEGSAPEGDGYFVKPTLFADTDPNARTAQEEIFGPVVSIIKVKDFEHLLEVVNGTEYGLTGALFSRDRARLERARHEFHVGNLYFNRKCTGALVGVQPFGGFKMSGTNSKAGGKDYLPMFMEGKSITERF